MNDLKDRVVMITGASSGFGREAAKVVFSIERMYAERSMVLWLMPSIPTDNPRIELRDIRVIAVADETIIVLLALLVLRRGNPGSRSDSREFSAPHHSFSFFSFLRGVTELRLFNGCNEIILNLFPPLIWKSS